MSEKNCKKGRNTVIVAVCTVIIAAVAVLLIIINANKPTYDAVASTASQTSAQTAEQPQGNISVNMSDEVESLQNFNAENIVKNAFSMKNQFAFEPFDKVSSAAVSKLTQFAFCQIFADQKALTDFQPVKNSVYRVATETNIKFQMNRMFEGAEKIDIKTSDLYNKKEKIFEMWQPNYKTDVFANCTAKMNGDLVELKCTFYSDSEKAAVLSEATVNVRYFKGDKTLPAGYRIVNFK